MTETLTLDWVCSAIAQHNGAGQGDGATIQAGCPSCWIRNAADLPTFAHWHGDTLVLAAPCPFNGGCAQ